MLKSEKIALLKIYELTVGRDVKGTVITNEQFIQKGLYRRDVVTKITKRLHNKGLIFKVKWCPHFWRYQLSAEGENQAVLLLQEKEK